MAEVKKHIDLSAKSIDKIKAWGMANGRKSIKESTELAIDFFIEKIGKKYTPKASKK